MPRALALVVLALTIATATAQLGDPNAGKTMATAWKYGAEDCRPKADGYKAQAVAEKAAYVAAMTELDALRTQVSQWCVANNESIPVSVSDQYESAHNSALVNETDGNTFFGAGVVWYNQGVSHYNSGLPLYVPYGYPMASQLFYSSMLEFEQAGMHWAHPVARESGLCAYSKYLAAKLDVALAYSALWTWFQTVNP